MTGYLFLGTRTLHVLLGAAWFGTAMFLTIMLGPTLRELGPGGTPIMVALINRRKLHAFIASIGGITVLTGFYLFWFIVRANPSFPGSHRGMALSIGALAGFIALIIGGSVIGRTAKQIAEIGSKVPSMPESERAAAAKTLGELGMRMGIASRIALALLTIAMVGMVIGHVM